jgi:CubicO group peptidase (beta-lactamase class C family)
MKPTTALTFWFGLLASFLAPTSSAKADEPAFEWSESAPAEQGMSAPKLDQWRDDLAKLGTDALLVIHHDRIVFEWYATNNSAAKPHGTASLAKSLVGGMSLAVALNDGRLQIDDAVAKFIPKWNADPRKSKITVAQLASHTSGLEDAEEDRKPHDQLTGWKGDFWKRKPDPFTISRDLTPAIFEPGEKASYSNPGMAMLAYTVTAAIQPGDQKDIRSLLRERIMRPIGAKDMEWSIGYGQHSRVEGLDLYANWGGAAFTARAAARVGRLMLRRGDWEGKQILDAKVVDQCLYYHSTAKAEEWSGKSSPYPVLGWYTNIDKSWPAAPRDAFCGAGAGHQVLLVVPSLDLIVVRNGTAMAKEGGFWAAVEKQIVEPAMKTITDLPYPPSDAIRRVRFDPPNAIIRKAIDSDNWPMTWGDDDAIYTSYGDGFGFEPLIDKKLSLGLARVEGSPPAFQGTNLRSATAERTGNGPKGAKASGMLMVDGVLYMWARNTDNATLAWSEDRGKTWTWGFKFDQSMGCPTFLNFGRNYDGARDDYVYVYSQDGPGAYNPYDTIMLARVPKARLREKEAYEFFTGIDADGKPAWSATIAKRGAVFTHLGHCERIDTVYNRGLDRYFLAVSSGHGQGWGLFDAPQPWGPWTTAYSTSDWGLGVIHGYRLPSKWISSDGLSMWLVFSGIKPNDAFCVRRMTLDKFPDLPKVGN